MLIGNHLKELLFSCAVNKAGNTELLMELMDII